MGLILRSEGKKILCVFRFFDQKHSFAKALSNVKVETSNQMDIKGERERVKMRKLDGTVEIWKIYGLTSFKKLKLVI